MPGSAQYADVKRELLQRIMARRAAPAPAFAIPRRAGGSAAPPLSLTQEELWQRERSAGAEAPPFYNESITVHGLGAVDVAALERSLAEILRRHEIWRTSYAICDSGPVQIVHPARPVTLPVVNLSGLPADRQSDEVRGRMAAAARRRLDLERGPLLRFQLYRLGEREHQLSLIAHQSIVDGVAAFQLFPTELAALYQAFVRGEPSPLPEPALQFGDFALWQRRPEQHAAAAADAAYWSRQLAGGVSMPAWPPSRPPAAPATYRGRTEPFALPPPFRGAVRQLCQGQSATLFTVLCTGLAMVLHRYTGQDDLVVGAFSPAGRQRGALQALLGYFLNPVALRLDLAGDPSFAALLRQTQGVLADALAHDGAAWESVVDQLAPAPHDRRRLRFNLVLGLQPATPPNRLGWSVTSMDGDNGGAVWDLYLAFMDRPEGLIGRAQFHPGVHDARGVSQLLADLQSVLAAAARDPLKRLSALPCPT